MRVRRRPTVWLAALLALLVGVALLPSAGAAESASERLGADGTREFAGADRYETAVLLAQAVVDARPVSSAIVASGESLVDATAAASLAAVQGSVVLLTRPDHLPASVAAFIEAAGLSEVTIVGGPAAVSVGVEAQLDAVSGVNTVSRVSGVDRYATSAAIAAQSETPGAFCGIERSVFLVGGSSLVDAIAAGPYAYAMGMPILFTEARGLPPAVSRYLRDANIQRAVVVGDLDAVSTAVDGQLHEAGIVHPWRIDGPDAPTRAVDLLKAVATCSETTISPDTVALVDAIVPIDGTTAAALLGTGLGVPNTVVPALVLTEPLPESVRHYLAPNRPEGEGPLYRQLQVLPLGGMQRLTSHVLSSVLRASKTPLEPNATITRYFRYPPLAHLGQNRCVTPPNQFLISFSSSVREADARDIGNYTVNGRRLRGDVTGLIKPENTGYVKRLSDRHFLLEVFDLPASMPITRVAIRANGIRTLDGQALAHHQVTVFEPLNLPELPTLDRPSVVATSHDDGRFLNLMVIGGYIWQYGPNRLPPETTSYHVDTANVTAIVGGQSYPLTDDRVFRRNWSCTYNSQVVQYYLEDWPELKFSAGDTLVIDSIQYDDGSISPPVTVPVEPRFSLPEPPIVYGSSSNLPIVRVPGATAATATVQPYLSFPPLASKGNLWCINPPNTWLLTFSEAVNSFDAETYTSYNFVRNGELVSNLVEFAQISDRQFQLRIRDHLRKPVQMSIRAEMIRTKAGGFVQMDPVWLTPWGHGTSEDGPTEIHVMSHDGGRMLTLFTIRAHKDPNPSWFWRSSSKNFDVSSDPLADGEALRSAIEQVDSCNYSGEGYTTWSVQDGSRHRFAAGDELTFPKGFFRCCGWPRSRRPLEEQTVTVWSWEQAQSARP